MAEGKKSFVLYSDLILVVRKLIEKDRKNNTNNSGELFYHLLQYVSDENPEPINDTIDLVFEPIKTQLKRDLEKWETRSDRSRENGKKGGRPKNLNEPEETQQVILEPEKPDTVIMCNNVLDVNANVNDTVNVNANVILLEKETKKFIFKSALLKYGFEENIVNDWLAVRKTKKATNTKTAFDDFILEIEKKTCNINEILKICVVKSWSGFKHKWIENLNKEENGKSEQSNSEIFEQAYNSHIAKQFRFGGGNN